jgi:hypothetical protein
MARKFEEQTAKPANDAYTGMLALSFVALLVGCTFLYMQYEQYTAKEPGALYRKADDQGRPPPEEKPGTTTPEEKKDEPKDDPKKDEPKDDPKKDDKKEDKKDGAVQGQLHINNGPAIRFASMDNPMIHLAACMRLREGPGPRSCSIASAATSDGWLA